MRLVVALCGVLSGAAALGFGWWGQQGLLFETRSFSPTQYVLVVLFVHAIALASIGGGMAVLVAPRIGRVAMLSSAVGWLLLVAVLGGGIRPVVGLLTLACALGGLGAFLPGLQTPLFRLERIDAPSWQPRRESGRSRRKKARPVSAPPPLAVYEDHPRPVVHRLDEEEDHSRPFVAPPPEPSPAIGAVEREDFYGSRRNLAPHRPRRRAGGTSWRAIAGVVEPGSRLADVAKRGRPSCHQPRGGVRRRRVVDDQDLARSRIERRECIETNREVVRPVARAHHH